MIQTPLYICHSVIAQIHIFFGDFNRDILSSILITKKKVYYSFIYL